MSDTKSPPLTSEEIGELERLLEKATPGPWRAMRDGNQYLGCWLYDGVWEASTLVGASRLEGPKRPWNPFYIKPAHELEEVARFQDDDADLIAAMRNALPRLLSSLKRAKEEGSAAQVPPPIASTAEALIAERDR